MAEDNFLEIHIGKDREYKNFKHALLSTDRIENIRFSFDEGEYETEVTLKGYKNIEIVGNGNVVFYSVDENKNIISLSNCENICIKNIIFEYKNVANIGNSYVIGIGDSKKIYLRNCFISNSKIGLHCFFSEVFIIDSIIYKCSFSIMLVSSNITVYNTSLINNDRIFCIEKVSSINIGNNIFENNNIIYDNEKKILNIEYIFSKKNITWKNNKNYSGPQNIYGSFGGKES